MNLSMFSLVGKVAIVTGAGRGIGRAIALGLAQAGADVVVAARTAADIDEVAAGIEDTGRKALAIPTDVRDIDQVTSMLGKTLASFGRVDILVNNAGGYFIAPVLDMSPRGWEAVIKENLDSVFICCKVIGEPMVKQKAGSIISVSSTTGLGPYPGAAHYAVAKAGIISLTKTLAVEWAPYNIRVNAIAPGFVETPATTAFWQENPKHRQAVLQKVPLGRLGKPEDIVGTAIFLASDASAYVTGETIVVSGGLTTTVFDELVI